MSVTRVTAQTDDSPNSSSEGPVRPDNVPEKFWDADTGAVNTDALLESYAHLEGKMGEATPEAPAADTTDATEAPSLNVDGTDAATQAAVESIPEADITRYGLEVNETGDLSDASYTELEQRGFAREQVRDYVEGQKAVAELYALKLQNVAGGPDGFNTMMQYASNLDQGQKEQFQAALNSGDLAAATAAVQGMAARAAGTTSQPPSNPLDTSNTVAAGGDTYASWDEAMLDMRSADYARSEAFRTKVKAKIDRSRGNLMRRG